MTPGHRTRIRTRTATALITVLLTLFIAGALHHPGHLKTLLAVLGAITVTLALAAAFAPTTETKNRDYAWAVHQHPEHGRTVLLIRDKDMSSLHHDWMYGGNGFLYRHGGYWWDGTRWYRPQQIVDLAYEGHEARAVAGAVTVTAIDVLARPATSHTARVAKIADFTASEGPLPHWREHLALWASHRKPGSRPLDQCVVDLQAPGLDPACSPQR